MIKAIGALAAVAAIGVTCSASATAQDPVRSVAIVTSVAPMPDAGCDVQGTTDTTRIVHCGDCVLLGFTSNAALHRILGEIVKTYPPRSMWLTIGPTWFAATASGSLSGAINCSNRLGGVVSLY